jgi:hypothetical protein
VNRTLGLITVGFLILTLASKGQQPQATPKSSLQGTVLKIGTNEAVTAAHVTLYRVVAAPSGTQSSTRAPSPTPLEFPTDGKGKFVFKDVEPGSYRLVIAANGFVKQEYGQRVYGAQGAIITLTADQSAKDLLVHLTPTGSISGSVRDSAGQPEVGVSVTLMRPAYNASGSRPFHPLPQRQQ